MFRKKTSPPVIYLIGTAGHPNYGDELITAHWLRELARSFPDAEVWLDSPRPGQAAVLFDGIHRGLRCVDTLFHACWNAPIDDPAATIEFGGRVIANPRLIPREVSGVQGLERVDLVHILGGGYINGIWPHHLALVGAARGIASRYGSRVAMTGAGLIPLVEGSGEALGNALSRFDIVDVRDQASYAAIRSKVPRATMTSDDALLSLNGTPSAQAHGTRGTIRPAGTMLCIQSDQIERPLTEIADYVVRTLQAWRVDTQPVTLVECLPPDDSAVIPLLSPHIPRLQPLQFAELWRSGLPAGAGQRWLSTRFHPHLLAAAAGDWGVAIPVSKDYYHTKHASLVELGSGWALADDLTEPVEPPSTGLSPFGGRLPALQAEKRKVAQQIAALIRAGRG